MNDNKILLKCLINNLQFTGLFDHTLFRDVTISNLTHTHYQYEFHIIAEGEYIIEGVEGGVAKKVSVGDVAIIPPNCYHNSCYPEDKSIRYRYYAFRLEIKLLDKSRETQNLYENITKNITNGKETRVIYLPWAVNLISEISAELTSNKFANKEMAEMSFKKFIIKLLREVLAKADMKGERFIKDYDDEKVIRNEDISVFFDKNYVNPNACASELAKRLNLSLRQLNRIFKEVYKTSFHKRLIDTRLAHAKRLLIDTDLNIDEIAENIGFSSSSGFFVAFKKAFGMTPREFKIKHKKI